MAISSLLYPPLSHQLPSKWGFSLYEGQNALCLTNHWAKIHQTKSVNIDQHTSSNIYQTSRSLAPLLPSKSSTNIQISTDLYCGSNRNTHISATTRSNDTKPNAQKSINRCPLTSIRFPNPYHDSFPLDSVQTLKISQIYTEWQHRTPHISTLRRAIYLKLEFQKSTNIPSLTSIKFPSR